MKRYLYKKIPLTEQQIERLRKCRDEEIQELRDRIAELENEPIGITRTELVAVVPGDEGYEDAPFAENSFPAMVHRATVAMREFDKTIPGKSIFGNSEFHIDPPVKPD